MNRTELVRRLVLNAICDDYENVDQVILRQAYLLSGTTPFSTELDAMPLLDAVEEDFKTYFYITKKGTDFLLSETHDGP